MSDSSRLSMAEAKLSGDADAYAVHKESFDNIQRALPEICSFGEK